MLVKLFERYAIKQIQSSKSIAAACEILRISWNTAQRIMEQAVERGMLRRKEEDIAFVGLDEKSFKKGQSYVSLLYDTDTSRVLEVEEGRSEEAARRLINKGLTAYQQEMVCVSCQDMAKGFFNAAKVVAQK